MATDPESREPVTPARPEPRGAPDTPPPAPPRELDHEDDVCRSFEADGVEWIARAAGKGAGGTGAYGLAMMEAVHFAHTADSATPLFEALLAAGRLATLYDEELRALLRGATRIVPPDEARPPQNQRPARRFRD